MGGQAAFLNVATATFGTTADFFICDFYVMST
jgi:hypothetical protein